MLNDYLYLSTMLVNNDHTYGIVGRLSPEKPVFTSIFTWRFHPGSSITDYIELKPKSGGQTRFVRVFNKHFLLLKSSTSNAVVQLVTLCLKKMTEKLHSIGRDVYLKK